MIVSPVKIPSFSAPFFVRRNVFGSGHVGVWVCRRSTARGLSRLLDALAVPVVANLIVGTAFSNLAHVQPLMIRCIVRLIMRNELLGIVLSIAAGLGLR